MKIITKIGMGHWSKWWKKSDKGVLLVFGVAIFLLVFLSIYMSIIADNEFLFYNLGAIVLFLLLSYLNRLLILDSGKAMAILVIYGLNLLGALVYIGGHKLYGFWIIQDIFRYDNVVHFCVLLVITVLVFGLLEFYFDVKMKHPIFMIFIAMIAAQGFGTWVEMMELIASSMLGAGENVGGYLDNAVDLVWNMFGTIAAAIFLFFVKIKPIYSELKNSRLWQ